MHDIESIERSEGTAMNYKLLRNLWKIIAIVMVLTGCVSKPVEGDPQVTTPTTKPNPEIIPSNYLPNQGITIFVWKDASGNYVGNYLEGIESKLDYQLADKELYSESLEQMVSMMEGQSDDMLYYVRGLDQELSEQDRKELAQLLDANGQSKKLYQGGYSSSTWESVVSNIETAWTVLTWKNNNQDWMFWSFYGLEHEFSSSELERVPLIEFSTDELVNIMNIYGNINIYVRGLDDELTSADIETLTSKFQDASVYIVYEGQIQY